MKLIPSSRVEEHVVRNVLETIAIELTPDEIASAVVQWLKQNDLIDVEVRRKLTPDMVTFDIISCKYEEYEFDGATITMDLK